MQPLRDRTFRLLWAGQTISLIGDFVYVVALPFQVLALGGSAVQIGAVAACSSASQLVLLLVGGALVDRWPRRRVILASDLTSGSILGLVAALGLAGALRIEYLYAAAALRGAALAFFTPAMGAIVPELVPSELLTAGNALRGLSRQAALVLGPALGGVLAASVGPAPAIAVDALSFVISFGLLWAAPRPSRSTRRAAQPAHAARVLDEIRAGLAFTFSLPWLWLTIFGFALINIAVLGAIAVALPLLVHDARVYGGLTAALGAGEGLASVVIAQVRLRHLGIVMYVGQAVAGLGLVGIAIVLGAPNSTFEELCQIEDGVLALPASVLYGEFETEPAVRTLLLRYVGTVLHATARNVACNRLHVTEQRLARWLLQVRDRVEADTFFLTQEFLGHMLGVRRPTVTAAVGALARTGLLRQQRGRIRLLDEAGLEAVACEDYARIRDTYAALVSV